MSCGWGWIPLRALTTCNASLEHYHIQSSTNSNIAIEILKEIYAKDEITRELFF